MQKLVCTASVPGLPLSLRAGKTYVVCLKYCKLDVTENPPVFQSTAVIICLPI